MNGKSWKDAQTFEDLWACGIRGFLFPDNLDVPEAEVVAEIKKSLTLIETGDYEVIAEVGE